MNLSLHAAFATASPRLTPRRMRLAGVVIHVIAFALFLAAIAAAFVADGIWAWSVGIFYIVYDTLLLALIAVHTRRLWHVADGAIASAPRPRLGVMIAAHNEALHLPATLDALLGQSDPADTILIADDGSDDATAQMLAERYGLSRERGGRSRTHPSLRWLVRVQRGGKARALNAALCEVDTDIVVTLDADTLLERDALLHMRTAFAADPRLVAAGGVIVPFCGGGAWARAMQAFQTYEYVRNVIARFAWTQFNGLVLISGAFAGYRREALVAIGGFDTENLVEDYELTHRLHRYRIEHGRDWRLGMAGRALARTESPSRPLLFLRQRRRWFAGYLQTQFANIDAVANPRFGGFGMQMLVIKAVDTVQPIFGLMSVVVLLALLLTGKTAAIPTIMALIGLKIAIDLLASLWIIALYRRVTGERAAGRPAPTLAAIAADFISFMPLRQVGAAWGWIAVLRGRPDWGLRVREAAPGEPQQSLD